jgi:hypothetical protein
MYDKRIQLTLVMIIACAAGGVVADDFTLDWWTVDGGGEMWTTGGDYELSGTIGQPDANETAMTGGNFELTGSFWVIASVGPELIPGDVDGDGDVDLADLAALLASYGACEGDPDYEPAADIDNSGCVDLTDLATLLSHYGEGL